VNRADRTAFVDFDERARSRRLNEPQAQKRKRRPDRDDQEQQGTRRLAGRVDAEKAEPAEHESLNAGDDRAEWDEK
jgi:hypothetical protein